MQFHSSSFLPTPTCPVVAKQPVVSHNHAVALAFARTGLPVLPCDQVTKRPLISLGFKGAITDERKINSWWRRWPDALVGVPTWKFWVLDVDAKPALADSMARLLDQLVVDKSALAASCGLVVATPGGGRHLYYRRTAGVGIRTAAGDIALGVDARGHDVHGKPTGYVIAPGCVLLDRRGYRIVSGALDAMLTGKLPDAPRGLLFLAMFSSRERETIAADIGLRDAIRGRAPIAWHAIFDSHRVTHRPALAVPESTGAHQMRRYAAAALHAEADSLAGHTDGRRDAVFRSACRLAKFAAHDVLTAEEITEALLSAWTVSGGAAVHGRAFAQGCIARGIAMGKNDALPVLDAGRHHRHTIGREDCL